jgi:hypothetical protein
MSDVPFDAEDLDTTELEDVQLPEHLVPVLDAIENAQLSMEDQLTLARVLLGNLKLEHEEALAVLEEGAADGEACINPSEVIAWAVDSTILSNALDILAALNLEEPAGDDESAPAERYD